MCGGTLHPDSDSDRTAETVYTDSRKMIKNGIYAAIRGETVDGNRFAPAVIEAGGCALVDNEEHYCKNTVLTDDVKTALRTIASVYRGAEMKNMTVIGVTGSVGKTTTKDMIACALSSQKKVHKTCGNANSQIGLPITVLDTDPLCDAAVLELGMSYPGEMERIAEVARPDISVVTNIGFSHIENLGTREAIRDEKLKISAFSPSEAVLVLNGDEPLLREYKGDKKVYFVSKSDKSCHCYAENIRIADGTLSFFANVFGKCTEVTLKVTGEHYVSNALFALACAHLCGVDTEAAAKMLADYKNDKKRLFVYETEGRTVISDCYNASPESMKAALSVLGKTDAVRRIAVLGDMLELGAESERLHLLVGGYAAENADVLITYGEQAKGYVSEFKGKEIFCFEKGESEKLREFLTGFLKKGDAVLYKASNGMKLSDAIV